MKIYDKHGRQITPEEAGLVKMTVRQAKRVLDRACPDWKDEKNCALCDIAWDHYESGASPEKRFLGNHLVCAKCFTKSK